ncbi:DsbA family protein, partial [Saccharomonospora saliphila]|uniref:DsbA family protein n=1 Tax=Saccharomonospora saliphila TaxID=369829 RepID=UPI00036E0151
MPKKPPRWYFSFRSPYSWLAYRDLVDHHPDVAEAIEWRPFWEPDPEWSAVLAEAGGSFPYVPMSQAKHRYILQDVRRLAAERGLAMRWPVDRNPRWEVAHLGYLAARAEGAGAAYLAEVYRGRWERGEDISSPEVVAAAA